MEALIDHGADLNARQQKGSPTQRVSSDTTWTFG